MPLPRPVVLGNWKMTGLRADALALAGELAGRAAEAGLGRGTLGLFPPATVLAAVAERLRDTGIIAGGQDCHERASGAFTGSLSAAMLKDAGAEAVIVGHSERRHGLGETDALVRAKAEAGLGAGLLVVLCVGETEAEWLEGRTLERLSAQLEGSLPSGDADGVAPDRLVVAYEPVWAIGTGRTASPGDIARVHAHISARLSELLPGGAGPVPVLYGGSVKPDNARDILRTPGVDGVLVGGACLDAGGFWSIHEAGGPG